MAEPLAALSIQPPQVAVNTTPQINPFQAGLDIMRMRQLANENQQFQLKQWAYQGASDIMAKHAGDEEGGMRELVASPYGPYASDYISTIRASRLALAQAAREEALTGKTNIEAGDTVLHTFAKNLGPIYGALADGKSPEEIEKLTNAAIQQTMAVTGGATKAQQQAALSAMQGIMKGLNASSDPMGYLSDIISTSGLGAEGMDRILGKFDTFTMPQGTFFGPVRRGAFTPQANPLYPGGTPGFFPAGYPPSMGEPGRVPIPGTGPFGGPLPSGNILPQTGGASAPNALGGATQPGSQYFPAPQQAPAAPAGLSVSSDLAGDGKPLWTPEVMAQNQPRGMIGTGNRFVYEDPGAAEAVQERAKAFNDKEAPAFRDSGNAMRQFAAMDASLDRLRDTLLVPGSHPEERAAAARAVNTGITLFNTTFRTKIPEFFGESLQAYDAFIKEMRTAQFNVLATQFGHQREAFNVVAAAGQAVPGIENSFLGDKLNLEELRAGTQRYQDMYNFTQEWMRTHRGDPFGADAVFNKMHPPEEYGRRVLEKFGLTREGFVSQDAINNAHDHNWITDDMAAAAGAKLKAQRLRQQQRQQITSP